MDAGRGGELRRQLKKQPASRQRRPRKQEVRVAPKLTHIAAAARAVLVVMLGSERQTLTGGAKMIA